MPGVRPPADYAGTASCAECHRTAYAKWQNTGHARALGSLAVRGTDADPNCLGCHTVGFGTASGYQRKSPNKDLANVGCESCHGPGSEHVSETRRVAREGGNILFKYRPVGAQDCTACHYGEFSRPFDYAAFWPNVQHGKEPVSKPKPTPTPKPINSPRKSPPNDNTFLAFLRYPFFARRVCCAPTNCRGRTDYARVLAEAAEKHQPVLLDFSASWCGPCRMMETTTFANAAVREEMKGYLLVKVDFDQARDLVAHYRVEAIPTCILLNHSAKRSVSIPGTSTRRNS